MNLCINCKTETKNPKYCSRSCSAKVSNKVPKRKKKIAKCVDCQSILNENRRKYCDPCLIVRNNFDEQTLGEVKGFGNSNHRSRIPYIRQHARKLLIESGREQKCQNCDYSTYVETCHVKAIADHDDSIIVKEINDLSNLIFLCRNCHWELDHGVLSFSQN